MRFIIYILLINIFASCSYLDRQKVTHAVKTIPSFDIQLLDSSTIVKSSIIPAGKSTVIIYFHTDCPYCQATTNMLVKNMDKLSNVQFYFLTPSAMDQTRWYKSYFKLDGSNIMVGIDYKDSFEKKFEPAGVPYMAIYSPNKELLRILVGEPKLENILMALHSISNEI
jgi:thioredoxin-related protein